MKNITACAPARHAMMQFLAQPPRFLFYTGKGGVGKTPIACATAMRLAASGQRVPLVSTDPAPNVGQVSGIAIGKQITTVPAAARLWALEMDPQAAAQGYRERIVAPVRGVLPEAEVMGVEEQLFGACTTEIAAFDEFTDLLTDAGLEHDDEHNIFDTAPTGHTIGRLQLPGAWSGFLDAGNAPWAWIVNNSIAALAARQARRHALVLLLRGEPVGVARLLALTRAPGGIGALGEPVRPAPWHHET